MTSRDFCFWLQGHFELNEGAYLSGEQVQSIRAHLALVFTHEIDPSMGDADHQKKLDEVHETAKSAEKKAEAALAKASRPHNPVYRC